jgi:hypothetical protein
MADTLDIDKPDPSHETRSGILGQAVRRARIVADEWWARSGGLQVKPSGLTGLVTRYALESVSAARAVLAGMADLADSFDWTPEGLRSRFPDETAVLLEDAALTRDRRFRIFGFEVDNSSGIRWFHDPRSGLEFDSGAFYEEVATPPGADINFPLELSRFHHLPRLALAYRLTGEQDYLNALVSQTGDWIARNPVGFGPNWSSPRDVGIRVANMACAFSIAGPVNWPADFSVMFATSLIEHGRFVAREVERQDNSSPVGCLGKIAGLAIAGCFLAPTVHEAESWRRFGRDELSREIENQILPDGWHIETSTANQIFALECFLIPAIVLEKMGEEITVEYRDRLKAMATVLRDIASRTGSIPIIGDNNSIRLTSFVPRPAENVNHLLALSAAWLEESSLKPPGLPPCPEILILLGEKGLGSFEDLRSVSRPTLAEFPDGGITVIRSENGRDFLTLQTSESGSVHSDKFSVTVWFDGNPLVVDPGTGVLNSNPARLELYRSTESHASIRIDGGDDVNLSRAVQYNQSLRQFEIEDNYRFGPGCSDCRMTISFPLAPELTVECRTSRCEIRSVSGKPLAEIMFYPGWKVEPVDGIYSPSYGVEQQNVVLQFRPPRGTTSGRFIIRALAT